MTKFLLIKMLTLAVVLSFMGLWVSAQPAIQAGASKVNITPPYGTIIYGDFLPMYTKVIRDSLYVRGLAFDNGQQRLNISFIDTFIILT